ncbi:MAG: DUF3015 family protein [Proteobacteria bacterium]|nr:DUF3015 family protein [Pseudomonadota bacterium]
MTKKILMLPIFMMFAFIGNNADAANPYVDCGIGAALFPNTDWAAVTSNVIWDAGTTALISATASEDTCSGGAVETAQLIHDKYELLETDIMLGSGENLAALTSSMQCESSPALTASIRNDIQNVLTDEGYNKNSRIEKSINFYTALQANTEVKNSCSAII